MPTPIGSGCPRRTSKRRPPSALARDAAHKLRMTRGAYLRILLRSQALAAIPPRTQAELHAILARQ